MKNSNICPICNSADIVRINEKMRPSTFTRNVFYYRFLKPMFINRYLCCNCGHIEEWIDSEEDLLILRNLKNYQN